MASEHLPEIVAVSWHRAPGFFLDFDGTIAPWPPAPTWSGCLRRPKLFWPSSPSATCLLHLRPRPGGPATQDRAHFRLLHSRTRPSDRRASGFRDRSRDRWRAPEGVEAAAQVLRRQAAPGRRCGGGGEGAFTVCSLSAGRRRPAGSGGERGDRRGCTASPTPFDRGQDGERAGPRGAGRKDRPCCRCLIAWALGRADLCPVCLGDDLTDEDMFAAADGWGVSVVVGDPGRNTRRATGCEITGRRPLSSELSRGTARRAGARLGRM